MTFAQGLIFAAVSSATFGLSPFFSVTLFDMGYSEFEVLFYRWGVASAAVLCFGMAMKYNYRVTWQQLKSILLLSLFRAGTSLSLIVAYKNISSGVASTIHFMYPLAVTLAMVLIFKEKKSTMTFIAITASIIGALCLTGGDITRSGNNAAVGIGAAAISVLTYSSYIVGVRKTRASEINSIVLTTYVMGFGTIAFGLIGLMTSGIRVEMEGVAWLNILGLALPATALSNMALVIAVKRIGPSLTSILGALEPLTAIVIGIVWLNEPFTLQIAIGIGLIIAAVTTVIISENRKEKETA